MRLMSENPMKFLPVLLLLMILAMTGFGCEVDDRVPVRVFTSEGSFLMAVDTFSAPSTSRNFLRYVASKHYDGGSFFRVVRMDNQPTDSIRIEVIQGGANLEKSENFFDPIVLERTSETGLLHVDGAISMARGGPDSATNSFFICIGDQPSLDFGGMRNPDGQGFAAFGIVLDGMDVIRAIQAGAVERQTLVDPVMIDSVRVEERP
jgi:peptidyl-prolyl cis-trans isomerase A (cyclophilin A)